MSRNKDTTRHTYRLIHDLREHMNLFGYEPVDLPIIEDANLFLVKAGDQIIKRLFTFEQHGQQFALRPEFTAAAAYHYVVDGNHPAVTRWQFSGPIFIDDPNDFSANHQQISIGAELIGMGGMVAEAEIIAMAVQGLVRQGIDDWQLIIGHTGLIRQVLARFGLDIRTERFLLHQFLALKNSKAGVLDSFDNRFQTRRNETIYGEEVFGNSELLHGMLGQGITMGGRTREEIAHRLAQKHHLIDERDQVVAVLNDLEKWRQITGAPQVVLPALEKLIDPADTPTISMFNEWYALMELLAACDIPLPRITIQPALARSWEYYTGTVFELRANGFHLGGGGRYDELARLVGGKHDIPAVGFAYYVDQLITALPHPFEEPKPPITIMFDEDVAQAAVRWAHQLRNHDIAVQLQPTTMQASQGQILIVESDAAIHWNQKTYSLEQINQLAADLT
jgi:histidyl-tRNA synthetase